MSSSCGKPHFSMNLASILSIWLECLHISSILDYKACVLFSEIGEKKRCGQQVLRRMIESGENIWKCA